MSRKKFEYFIDKLCQNFDNQKIKILVDNGFDEWQLVQQLKIKDLKQLGYSAKEIKLIIQQINLIYIQFQQKKTHSETDNLAELQAKIQKQIIINKKQVEIVQNQINIQWLIKGTSMKATKPYQKFLENVTMISLQQKKLTKICELSFMQKLQIIHLGNNFISRIEGIQNLNQLKTLKLDYNLIRKIQNLHKLKNLTKLVLNNNQIQKLEGLSQNYSLIQLTISDQRIQKPFQLQQESLQGLGTSLEVLYINGNKINQINQLKHLKLLSYLEIKNNNLKQVSQIADVVTNMTRIKSLIFLGNPIVKSQKYRDYLVILSKSLQQLDNKKILPSERQYLVKLYSLKHAKQKKQEQDPKKGLPSEKSKEYPGMSINKINEKTQENEKKIQKLNSPTDFYNNSAYTISKHTSKK